MSKVKVYQCFMFLKKNTSTTYHNLSSRLTITRRHDLPQLASESYYNSF